MQYYLRPCLHCSGRSKIESKTVTPGSYEAWGECEVCGIRTQSYYGTSLDKLIADIRLIWNRSDAIQPPACDADFNHLVLESLGPEDGQDVLRLLARTIDKWDERGPKLSAMAQHVLTCELAHRDIWPVDTALKLAERFLKILPLSTWQIGDEVDSLIFGPISTIKRDAFAIDDNEIYRAIDLLPNENPATELGW